VANQYETEQPTATSPIAVVTAKAAR